MSEQESKNKYADVAQPTEAPCSASIKTTIDGFEWMLTIRAMDGAELMENVEKTNKWLMSKRKAQPQAPSQAPRQAQPAAQPQAPGGDVEGGIDVLKRLDVLPGGKFEFHVGKFKWPFKEGRGVAVASKLFDDGLLVELGIDLTTAGIHDLSNKNIYVVWEKPKKYHDITRVFSRNLEA